MRLRTIALGLAVLAGTAGSRVAIGGDTPPPGRARFRVRITEFQFTPRNLQAHVGDTIVWTNFGTMNHSSVSRDNVWNSGTLAPGASFSLVVGTPGNFPYRCSFHPVQMQGTLRVLP